MPEPITFPTTTAIAIPSPSARTSDGGLGVCGRDSLGKDMPRSWRRQAAISISHGFSGRLERPPASGSEASAAGCLTFGGFTLFVAGTRFVLRHDKRLEAQVDGLVEGRGTDDVVGQHIHHADLGGALLLLVGKDAGAIGLVVHERLDPRAQHVKFPLL